MGTHIIRSVAAPADAPTSEQLGTHWLKTTDPVGHWLAVDTSVDGWLDLVNLPSGGGGSGEANTTSNVGTGSGQLAKAKDGVNLPFKTIKAGSNITVTNNTDDVEISGPAPGEVNTTSNAGTGEGLAKAKSGADLPLKTLKAGANITLTASTDEIEIAASGGGGGGLEVSGGMVPVTVAGNKWYNTWQHRGFTDNAVSAYSGGMWPERFPVVVGGSMTLASIVMEASVAATSKLRLAIYSSDPTTGLPLTKLWEGVKDLAAETNATIAVSPTVALTPGVYWVAVWQYPSFDMVAMDQMDAYFFGDFNMFSSNSSINAATSFPTSINPSTITASFVNSVPKIKLQ